MPLLRSLARQQGKSGYNITRHSLSFTVLKTLTGSILPMLQGKGNELILRAETKATGLRYCCQINQGMSLPAHT